MHRKRLLCWKAYLPRSSWPTQPTTPIICARPSLPKARSPSSPTTRHGRSNIRSTSISMPSAISWSVASQTSNNSAASQPASKRQPEITLPSSLSQPSSYGCDKCPHHLVHWHGQLPPWKQDGFPWPQTPPIPAGDTQSYDYAPIVGTYWMHSHHGMQEQSLMTAPLIVRSAEDMRADRQEVVLMLHDFSFKTPDELLAGLTKSNDSQSAMPKGGMAKAMNMDSGSMGAMKSGTRPGMAMDLNDVDFDAFLANDRTLADPEVVRTEPGGRVRLRLINGASSTQFWIDLGTLAGTVVAVDGHPVRPLRG